MFILSAGQGTAQASLLSGSVTVLPSLCSERGHLEKGLHDHLTHRTLPSGRVSESFWPYWTAPFLSPRPELHLPTAGSQWHRWEPRVPVWLPQLCQLHVDHHCRGPAPDPACVPVLCPGGGLWRPVSVWWATPAREPTNQVPPPPARGQQLGLSPADWEEEPCRVNGSQQRPLFLWGLPSIALSLLFFLILFYF